MDFCKFKANIARLKLITVDTNTSKTQKETERHTQRETKKKRETERQRELERETEKVYIQCSQQVNKATWVCKKYY